MARTKKTPEERVEGRLLSILVCFTMTSAALVIIPLSFLLLLLPNGQDAFMTVSITALAVAEVFGLTAVGLFLAAPTAILSRLLKGRDE